MPVFPLEVFVSGVKEIKTDAMWHLTSQNFKEQLNFVYIHSILWS